MGIQFKKSKYGAPVPVNYGKSTRTPPKIRWMIIVVLISLPFLLLISELVSNYIFVRFPGMISFDTLTIRAPGDGYIRHVSVEVGDKIQPHQLLMQFVSPDTVIKLQFLLKEKKRLQLLMNQLKKKNQYDYLQALHVAKNDVVASKALYERFKNYVSKGDMALLQLETSRKNYVSAQRQYEALLNQKNKDNLENNTLIEVNFQRKILELQNHIDELKDKIKHYHLVSPQSGTIKDLFTYNGEYVSNGQKLLTLVTNQRLRILAFIDPKYGREVVKGKIVTIILPDKTQLPAKIVNKPGFAERMPMSSPNPLAPRKNKLVAVIKPEQAIPLNYRVFGVPVKIKF